MNFVRPSLIGGLALGFAGCLAANPGSPAGVMPTFVQVGKTLRLGVSGSSVKVVELGTGGWVKATMVHGGETVWVNLNAVELLQELPG